MSDDRQTEISHDCAVARTENLHGRATRGCDCHRRDGCGRAGTWRRCHGCVSDRTAIGQLALGRAKVRRGQVDDLEIARLTIRELTIERVR